MYSSAYPFWITVWLGPLAALVCAIVVALLAQDLVVGVIAGIVGLAVGLVVGYVLTEASFRWWPSEYDPVDPETDEHVMPEDDSDEPGWEDDLNQVQLAMIWTMTQLRQRAKDEHRELTALEKGEMKRLRAKIVEVSGVHEAWRDRLLTPIAMMFSMAVIFGGTITALVVTLLVGWLLSG